MGLYKKISFLLVIVVTVGFVIINTDALSFLAKPINLNITEEAFVQKASFDSINKNTLFLDVQSKCSKTIVFNTAVIKNSEQYTVATIVPFLNELPAYKNITITVDLTGINLGSGNYTINLWTTKSHVFSSPSFSVA